MTEIEKRMLKLLRRIANDPNGQAAWLGELNELKAGLERLEAAKLGTPPERLERKKK